MTDGSNAFFEDSHPELEAALRRHLERVRQGLAEGFPELAAVLLGGGYGRGEGGVRLLGGTALLHNDLDYFVFVRGPASAALRERVRELSTREGEALRIEVDFELLPVPRPEAVMASMMLRDLAAGFHRVCGSAEFLPATDGDGRGLPLAEATRLLWNRGSGLYFARQRLAGAAPEVDFVWRNHQKARLALGDAILCLHDRYHARVRERARRIAALGEAVPAEVRNSYEAAVQFKLHPASSPLNLDGLRDDNRRLSTVWKEVFLAVENRRLGTTFRDGREYVLTRRRLYPAASRWRCLALAMRDRLRRGGSIGSFWDYPRAALQKALLLLLEEPPQPEADRLLQRLLRPPRTAPFDDPSWAILYERWWAYYR